MAGDGHFIMYAGLFSFKCGRQWCSEPAGEGNVGCPDVCVLSCSAVFFIIINHDDLNFPFTAVKLIQRYSMESCSILRRH